MHSKTAASTSHNTTQKLKLQAGQQTNLQRRNEGYDNLYGHQLKEPRHQFQQSAAVLGQRQFQISFTKDPKEEDAWSEEEEIQKVIQSRSKLHSPERASDTLRYRQEQEADVW